MDEHLLSLGTEKATLTAGEVIIAAADLQKLMRDAIGYRALLGRVDRRRDARLVDAAVKLGDLDLGLLKDHDQVKAQVERIYQRAQKEHPELEVRLAKIERDVEHDCDALVFQTTVQGAPRETRLNHDYLAGPEWGELTALHAALAEIGHGPYRLQVGEGEEEVADVFAAVEALKRLAQAGQSIQRYKGLGEMNPEQLWETTMDPARRSMLQVRVDDAIEANEVFSVLMGDAVEPRREFIEKHALDAQNLDI
jgi:DNA gyrase subunit B